MTIKQIEHLKKNITDLIKEDPIRVLTNKDVIKRLFKDSTLTKITSYTMPVYTNEINKLCIYSIADIIVALEDEDIPIVDKFTLDFIDIYFNYIEL